MILTKEAILEAIDCGDITIDPFIPGNVNPNSYNYRLSPQLLEWSLLQSKFVSISIPETGLVLYPGRIYLGATFENIGTKRFAMMILGRSSIGRLGLFVNVTADLGHRGSLSQWTLELRVVQPLRIYPRQKLGQISFWLTSGSPQLYAGKYLCDVGPQPNKHGLSLEHDS